MIHVNQATNPKFPRLTGKHVYLRPVVVSDYAHLQIAETAEGLGPRWRFRGSTPSPEAWAHTVWNAVLVQYLVIDRNQEVPLGIVVVYGASFQDGYARLAAGKFDQADRSPKFMLGVGLALRYVFTCWPLRKLYLETPEYNYAQFASGAGKLFDVEARLHEYSYLDGRYWDELILSLSRAVWEQRGLALLALEDERAGSEVWVKMPALSRAAALAGST